MPGLTAILRRFITALLALALLGALWTTALGRLSDHDSAVSMLTAAGTDLINPLLVSNSSGLAQNGYAALQQAAVAHPDQPLPLLFVKPAVLGKEIVGKSFADGSRAIYHDVAEAYYTGGAGAAFSLPAQLQQLVATYSPFIQPGAAIPAIPGLPGAAPSGTSQSPLPKFPLPQLPAWGGPFYRTVGITPATLTAQGHSDELFVSRWFWLAAGLLGLLLALFSAGWTRLSSVAWAVFHSAWTVTLLALIAAYLVGSHPAQAAPYQDFLNIIGGAFFPVYATATIAGLLGVVAAFLLPRLLKVRMGQAAVAPSARAAKPHPYDVRGGYAPGGQGGGQQGYPSAAPSVRQSRTQDQYPGQYAPTAPAGYSDAPRPQRGYSGGQQPGSSDGPRQGYPGGQQSGYPGGQQSGYPGGQQSGYPGGQQSGYPGGMPQREYQPQPFSDYPATRDYPRQPSSEYPPTREYPPPSPYAPPNGPSSAHPYDAEPPTDPWR